MADEKQTEALAALTPERRARFKFKRASEVRRGDYILRGVIDGVGCCFRVVDMALDARRPSRSDRPIRFVLNNGEECEFPANGSVAMDDSPDGAPDTPSRALLAAVGFGVGEKNKQPPCAHPDTGRVPMVWCRHCGYWIDGKRVGPATDDQLKSELASASGQPVDLQCTVAGVRSFYRPVSDKSLN